MAMLSGWRLARSGETLQPSRVHRRPQDVHHRQPRSGAHLNQLRRAPEPHHAPAHAAVHSGLTNAFSKKLESHVHKVALYAVWYNWIRLHKSLRVTPVLAAGLTHKQMSFEDIVTLMDAAAPAPERP